MEYKTLSMGDAMMKRFGVEKKTGGVNHPFNDAVSRVVDAITDQSWSFGRWCGYLRGIPPSEIDSMLTIAKRDSSNVGRKFHWLVKQYKNHD